MNKNKADAFVEELLVYVEKGESFSENYDFLSEGEGGVNIFSDWYGEGVIESTKNALQGVREKVNDVLTQAKTVKYKTIPIWPLEEVTN